LPKQPRKALIAWLGQGGIEAVIMNPKSAGTYSYWTAEQHGAASSTVELGRIGTLGQNDLSQFAAMSAALHALLRGRACAAGERAAGVQHRAVDHQAVRRFSA
jgi:succinylglutamate desuccinylase